MAGIDKLRELRRRTVRNHIFFWVLLPVGIAVVLGLLAAAELGDDEFGLATAWGAVGVIFALPIFLMAGAFEISLLFFLDRAKKLGPEQRAAIPVATFGLFVIPFLIPPWHVMDLVPVLPMLVILGAMFLFNVRYWKQVERLQPAPELL